MENIKLGSPSITPRDSDWSYICTLSQHRMTEKDKEIILEQKEILIGSTVLWKEQQLWSQKPYFN